MYMYVYIYICIYIYISPINQSLPSPSRPPFLPRSPLDLQWQRPLGPARGHAGGAAQGLRGGAAGVASEI